MRYHGSLKTVKYPHLTGPVLSVVVAILGVLAAGPDALHAQQDSTVSLETGDRVKIWHPEADFRGDTFEFERWEKDTLILLGTGHGQITQLSAPAVERLQVRREAGNHLWDGVLIGSGVGLAVDLVAATITCAPEFSSGNTYVPIPCMVGVPILLIPVTVLPGAAIGGVAGAMTPHHEWVSVDVGSTLGAASGRPIPGQGISFRVELGLDVLP